jgi:xylan 1,4-beta-xylosidase
MEALAYWVISDHFEELGRPPALFHNGFGLLTVGNLRKPRYWAVHLAAHLGDDVLAVESRGDGADVLVRTWATRHQDGTVDVLIWNGTINAALMDGDSVLDRDVRLTVNGLDATGYTATLARVDQHHSNILDGYPDDAAWPDELLWKSLHAHDYLHEEPLASVAIGARDAGFEISLPMPGIARIRLVPSSEDADVREVAEPR